MFPVPFPLLVPGHQAYVVRAHRLRGAAVAELFRQFARWISVAAR